MIKAIFFDIDGTLIPFGTRKLPESTYNSLLKIKEETGIHIIIATGKSLASVLKQDLMRIPFDGFLTLNGQLCYDKDFRMNFVYPIIPEEMDVLKNIFNDHKIPFILIGEFSKYINFMNEKMLYHLEESNDVIPDVGEYRGERIYQITAAVTPRQREILESTMDYCQITAWSEDTIDIFCRGGGKSNAVKNLLRIYNLKPEEIMAFGDSENDIGMLKYAGIGVAMGNASDNVKAVSDYITDTVDNDGIEKALKHFNII